jgi:integrase
MFPDRLLEVLRETGLRRGDAVRVGRQHVKDGVIRLATEKTGERVAVAMSDILAAAIEAGPVGDMTFIVGAGGKPMVKEAFGNVFREWCNAAGVAKSAHGLRKAAATADALDGFTDAELDAKFGWRGRKMASKYTESASRERLSLAAANRVKQGTKSPAPAPQGAGISAESQMKTIRDRNNGGPGRTRTCNQTVMSGRL